MHEGMYEAMHEAGAWNNAFADSGHARARAAFGRRADRSPRAPATPLVALPSQIARARARASAHAPARDAAAAPSRSGECAQSFRSSCPGPPGLADPDSRPALSPPCDSRSPSPSPPPPLHSPLVRRPPLPPPRPARPSASPRPCESRPAPSRPILLDQGGVRLVRKEGRDVSS